MKQQAKAGRRQPAGQPAQSRKPNAWWRRLKINRAVRRYPYVISEGEVWFGRKTPDQRAFVWLEADESVDACAADDASVRGRA